MIGNNIFYFFFAHHLTDNSPVSTSRRLLDKKTKEAFLQGMSQSEVKYSQIPVRRSAIHNSAFFFILDLITFVLVFVYVLLQFETIAVEVCLKHFCLAVLTRSNWTTSV